MSGRVRVLVVGEGPPAVGGIPSFLSWLTSDPSVREGAALQLLNTSSGRLRRPGRATIANALAAARDAARVRRRARGVDVVHLNLAPAPALPLLRALLLCSAARAGGARVILHAHSGRIHRYAERRLYRTLLRAILRVADVLVVVSASAQAAVAGLGGTILRLPNAVDPARFPTGPKADPPLLAFVGTVCERKGLLDLRTALLAASPAPRVVVVGDGDQERPGAFSRMVAAYRSAGLSDVEFTGSLDSDRVARTLSRASIFCLPSEWEGFPFSILEAMAAGTAVVATMVGDVPEMLDYGRAGLLVRPHDPVGLAEAISRLAGDPALRARLGRLARERAEREYSPDRLARSLLALYERVADPVVRPAVAVVG